MPTTRRRIARPIAHTITHTAVACWKAGDYWGLHRALGLHVCQMPDWDSDPPGHSNPFMPGFKQPPDPEVCKAQLVAIAGPPPRRWWFRRDDDGKLVDDGLDD
jgi:hypothetical protein